MATPFRLLRQVLPLAILLASVGLAQSQSPFSASPESLLALAAANKPAGEPGVHLLRMDQRLSFDAQGRSTYYSYRIFHILTEEDMESWSTVGASWAPWHQDKPTLRARVITPDGRQHLLDPATINEGPTREYSRDIFSDRRALRAPSPPSPSAPSSSSKPSQETPLPSPPPAPPAASPSITASPSTN